MGSLKIIYVLGAGRSGSTVLGDVLGAALGSRHLGEVRGAFDYSIDRSGLMGCSCGAAYTACPFWSRYFVREFGEDWVARFALLRLEGRLPRMRTVFGVRGAPSLPAGQLESATAQVAPLVGLLRRIAREEGLQCVVDSSKAPVLGWLLAQSKDTQVGFVHLVRDPVATIHSWTTRPIPIYDPASADFREGTRSAYGAAADWLRTNLAAARLRESPYPYVAVRYDDLVSRPLDVVAKVGAFAQELGLSMEYSPEVRDELGQQRLSLPTRHLMGGNPRVSRARMEMTLQADDGWRNDLPVHSRVGWSVLLGRIHRRLVETGREVV